MSGSALETLPIAEVLGDIREIFTREHELVLQAPPGAGKTTGVPLALLHEPWLGDQRILMLEPRRVAARNAAQRMASLLGESVGGTVGYRIRLESRVSANTRIEVITEGILARRLQQDPGLQGVGLLIFDEFHERHLDSDLGLALALQGREVFREGAPLKLLLMSATLDGQAVSHLLGGAPVLTSEGRQYPVDLSYTEARRSGQFPTLVVVDTVQRALRERPGNVLVFLPGVSEISRVARELTARVAVDELMIAPLHGSLPLALQQRAIDPPPEGERKVVLATNIAETSLTIEGIHTVVDAGLVREAVFDAATSTTRLRTHPISRASAEQRAGRAGRLAPGHCYRLWSAEQQGRLVARAVPEILQADLAPLALQLLAWGEPEPAALAWLDPPPPAPWSQALQLLQSLQAAQPDARGHCRLTAHGENMAALPLHPRLAHMVLRGLEWGVGEEAALLAAALAERSPLAGTDTVAMLQVLLGERSCPRDARSWLQRCKKQAGLLRRRVVADTNATATAAATATLQRTAEDITGPLLALAWPDRIARRRGGPDSAIYQLSNGRSAQLRKGDALQCSEWLAVADLGGEQGGSSDRIYSAAPLQPLHFEGLLTSLCSEHDIVAWDNRAAALLAERRRCVGKLILTSQALESVSSEQRVAALLGVVRRLGLGLFEWSPLLLQWRSRVALLRQLDVAAGVTDSCWPDLSDQALLATLEQWLPPWLNGVRRQADFRALDLGSILHSLLPWPLPRQLDELAPLRITVPSGSTIAIDYQQSPPVLAVKLQEMFGCKGTPGIAGGRVQLVLHLLSPARRPLQVTQDLAGFWEGAYGEVRKEMKGRYPKHPWPEDPAAASPTRHTSRRAKQELKR